MADDRHRRVRDAALALVAARGAGATVCPSEAARVVAAGDAEGAADWRAAMPVVHEVVDDLLGEGLVRISWKGRVLPSRAGPYRLRPGG